jgi:polyphosphate kinase
VYTDIGLFTCRPEIGADSSDLFNSLTGVSRQKFYRRLVMAPAALRRRTLELIDREAAHATAGRGGRIIAKMNALVDPEVIAALYRASQAGVEVDLIVRGICCLVPGLRGVSDRIRVVSIIGRFLEHSRVAFFSNGGNPEYFIGSADWMPRNFDRRVEAMAPIEDVVWHGRLQRVLELCLSDTRQAWELGADGTYRRREPHGADEIATHATLMRDPWGSVEVKRAARPGKRSVAKASD